MIPYRPHGDLRRLPLRESEDARGNAAERNTLAFVLLRQHQAGTVTGGKLFFMPLCQPSLNNGTYRVNHVSAREVERGRDLCLSCRFLESLLLHDSSADIAKLNSGIGMDAVVDAVVAGLIASGHVGIGGVDDGVAGKRRDVALLEKYSRHERFETVKLGNAFFADRFPEIFVLHPEKVFADLPRSADVE